MRSDSPIGVRPRFAEAEDGREEMRSVLGVAASASGRRWVDRLGTAKTAAAQAMAQRYGLPEILARVLAGREVALDQAADYLAPSLKQLMPDPSLLRDMDSAAERLADAVERREKIAIFADYDVDGATSAALAGRFLRALGLDAAIYIPDRLLDGYGPNPRAVGDLAAEGATLLLTLDCGTQSFEAFEAAHRLRLDVVTFDHHQTGIELPAIRALVNPNRQDDLSGQEHLAAVGVTFLGLVAINRELRRRGWYQRQGLSEPDLIALLDLVALGTVCDVVPLKGLNRAFVTKGLTVLRGRGNKGLAALADVVRLSGPPGVYHLGYLLGPRINAGGRIGDSTLGARLLMTEDQLEARRHAASLDQLNRERQALEGQALEEAQAMVAASLIDRDPQVIVAASPDWHPGIVGLVAARLKERYHRPAIAIALDEAGGGTGSARSIPGVDIGTAVRAAVAAGIAVRGGGHAMAAGLAIKGGAGHVALLSEFMAHHMATSVASACADEALPIDGALTASGATVELVGLLEKAGPFGAGQPDPVFAFPSHRIAYAEPAGGGHIRLQLVGGNGSKLKAVAFRAVDGPLGDFLLKTRDRPVHLAGVLSLDHWQGEGRVQLRVTDAADPVQNRP